MGGRGSTHIPDATLERLVCYERVLRAVAEGGSVRVSSQYLADCLGLSAAIVRRDLSYLGSLGTRGTGYDVAVLLGQIQDVIGIVRPWPVAIIGAGNLGRALAGARSFTALGHEIIGAFDNDPAKVGTRIGTCVVRHVDELEDALRARACETIAVLAVPEHAAQALAWRLVRIGVRAVLNFAPVALELPPGVAVRNVDLSTELAVLTYHLRNHRQDGVVAEALPVEKVSAALGDT